MNTQVYLSLGGNQGEVLPRLQHALALLAKQAGVNHLITSHFYQTSPLGIDSSTWFVNAVCSFQTSLTPQEVFATTQTIEVQLGKIRKPKDASRPIDIDLLFYGQQVWRKQDLEIPHPRWKERLFVLVPLKDLTQEILIQHETRLERYVLQELIDPLVTQTSQVVSLLEKNPLLQ